MAPLAALDISSKMWRKFRGRTRVVNITGSNNKGMNSEEMINEFDPINLIQTCWRWLRRWLGKEGGE